MSQNTHVILFDADGVVIQYPEWFSNRYSRENNVPHEKIQAFFDQEFEPCVIGKADLKEILKPWLSQWNWDKSVDALLQYWFKVEDVPNKELIHLVGQLQSQNMFCCLASNQEKYRSAYLFENMRFGKLFDHCFFSYEIKAKKPEIKYWEYVWDSLQYLTDIENKSQVMFWDDSQANVDTASEFGFQAHVFENNKQFIQELSKASINLQP